MKKPGVVGIAPVARALRSAAPPPRARRDIIDETSNDCSRETMKPPIENILFVFLLILTSACGVVQVKGPDGLGTKTPSKASATEEAPTGGDGRGEPASGDAEKSASGSEASKREHLDAWLAQCDTVEAALESVPADRNLIEDIDAVYPSTAYVPELKKLFSLQSVILADYAIKTGPLSTRNPTLEQLIEAHPEYAVVKTRLAALEDKVARSVKLPKERYKGADLHEIHEAFKKYAGGLEDPGTFVAVTIVTADWNRKKGLTSNGVSYDQGFVTGYFVIERSPDRGEVWRVRARKDWLDGGKIKFDVYAPSKIVGIQLPLR